VYPLGRFGGRVRDPPQRGGSLRLAPPPLPGQVGGFDVELLVLLEPGLAAEPMMAAIGVALGADRRGLVDRQRVGLGPGQHRPERPVHVHAGHGQQADIVAGRGQGGLGDPPVAAPEVQRRLQAAFDPNGVLAPGRSWSLDTS